MRKLANATHSAACTMHRPASCGLHAAVPAAQLPPSQAMLVSSAKRGPLQGVSVCGDCFNVSGPANATVDFFSYAAQANSTYQVAASWEASYRGPITIGLEAQRRGARNPATLFVNPNPKNLWSAFHVPGGGVLGA